MLFSFVCFCSVKIYIAFDVCGLGYLFEYFDVAYPQGMDFFRVFCFIGRGAVVNLRSSCIGAYDYAAASEDVLHHAVIVAVYACSA
ncbi:hypothetical protein BW14_00260 [Bifidobacterium sp. UTBIF-68]|nr:hypothetical protein BW14_00260 [Bifidobacterium sp. UTBIF-68]